jgi:hypothetical protein
MPTNPRTSPFPPDMGAVRAWMEEMIRTLRFAELVVAVVAFIARMCEINRELTKKLAVPSRAGRDESSRDRRDEMKWRCESGRPG